MKYYLLSYSQYDHLARAWVFRDATADGESVVDAWVRFVGDGTGPSRVLINGWECTAAQVEGL